MSTDGAGTSAAPGASRPPARKDKDKDASHAVAAAAAAAVAAAGHWEQTRPQSAVLADFWARQLTNAGITAALDFPLTPVPVSAAAATGEGHTPSMKQTLGLTFPMKPVKRLMKADPAVMQKIGYDATAVMAVVLELFLRDLATRAACHMARARRTRMTAGDVTAAAVSCDSFDFLIDVLPPHELDAARAAARENRDHPHDDTDLLALALAHQRRNAAVTLPSALVSASARGREEGVAASVLGTRTGGRGTLSPPGSPGGSSPAQLLQQHHLQTLMALSAHAGTSVLPVAHEYAALAAASLAASQPAPAFSSPLRPPPFVSAHAIPGYHQQQQPLLPLATTDPADFGLLPHQQDNNQQQQTGYPDVPDTVPLPPDTTTAAGPENAGFLPFFAFQPTDAGVEGLSTVAIAHEAAEAESMDRGYTSAPGVQPSTFPTLWAQQPQMPEHEELPDANSDDDFDDDDYADEEFDLYDPDEEEEEEEDDEEDVGDDGENSGDNTIVEQIPSDSPPRQRQRHNGSGGT